MIDVDVLVKLLNEYHNLNVTKENILEYSKLYDNTIFDNKYISFFEYLPEGYKNHLLLIKDSYKKYKKLDIESDYVQDLIDELNTVMDKLNEDNQSIIVNYLLFPLFNGLYDKLKLKEYLRQNKLTKYFNTLDAIACKYKNKIGIWTLNGYTLKDGIIVSNKIGRNDLCPCGSGKKYKNCCGK